MNGLIQVAGVIDFGEAEMLMSLGVDYLGFPLRLPVNKDDLTEEDQYYCPSP
jgi:phosphoribosylanthranilate isomerase